MWTIAVHTRKKRAPQRGPSSDQMATGDRPGLEPAGPSLQLLGTGAGVNHCRFAKGNISRIGRIPILEIESEVIVHRNGGDHDRRRNFGKERA